MALDGSNHAARVLHLAGGNVVESAIYPGTRVLSPEQPAYTDPIRVVDDSGVAHAFTQELAKVDDVSTMRASGRPSKEDEMARLEPV